MIQLAFNGARCAAVIVSVDQLKGGGGGGETAEAILLTTTGLICRRLISGFVCVGRTQNFTNRTIPV